MRLSVLLITATISSVLVTSAWGATSVFAPRPPPFAPPDVVKADESAFKSFLDAHCKIREAMGSTAEDANSLIKEATIDLNVADNGFGKVAKNSSARDLISVQDTPESKDAYNSIKEQNFPKVSSFATLFRILQVSIKNEVNALSEIKFTGNDLEDLRIAINVEHVQDRTQSIYVAVSTLSTIAALKSS